MQFKQLLVFFALSGVAFAADEVAPSDGAEVVSTLSATRVFNTELKVAPFLTVATETVTWTATFTPSDEPTPTA
ncbi:hypothetical protein NLI96_g4636 [Meripilus lineatus]|uniref:Uncharacterized protein n=1 Tax=Meripilus lineatus TaxID=2056292 RepID=A0AAD5V9U0_9APHY|nr:hypothetical protein NLI96_g4636 [Physisporinus lineatus]